MTRRPTRAHRKVARQRRDFTHKASTKTVKRALKRCNGRIFLGDVSSSGLAQTRMAKSVLDACWSAYRSQVLYKSQQAGIEAGVVNERYSTQECSECHALTGPKGLEGLKTRHWVCSACGAVHDRDVNSARLVRSRGDHALVLKTSGCARRERHGVPGGENPPRLSVAPAGSNRSSWTWSSAGKLFGAEGHIGDLASVQAVT